MKNLLTKIKKKRKKLFHDILGWGYPVGLMVSGDYFQQNFKCEFCDGELTKDSTGVWFHLTPLKVMKIK